MKTRFTIPDNPRAEKALRDAQVKAADLPIAVRLPLVRLEDGAYALDQDAAREFLVGLGAIFEIGSDGQLAFSSTSTELPIALDGTSGAIELRYGDGLESKNDKLQVDPAVALANTAGLTLAALETEVNTLKQRLRDAKLMEP